MDDRSRTHVRVRPQPLCGGSFPLSAHPPARLLWVTFAPRIIYGQGQDIMPTAADPAPGTYHREPQTR